MNSISRLLTHTLILVVVSVYSGAGITALFGDSTWLVEKGDSVYSIARIVFPDDADKQRQFRNELIRGNPAVFGNNANKMSIGDRLTLPGFAVAKPPVVVPSVKTVVVKPALDVTPATKTETADPEDIIGRVVISRGDMQASNRGVFRDLLRHSEIFKGDTLTTSARSYTQIRMKDGALISLRPNTELVITEYNFNGDEDGSERSFFELVRGGFRTITGYIGHKNKRNYRVKTAVATIGIRGTHYGLMICAAGSCNAESADLEDGVYGGVVDGSIVVENEAGRSTFNNDQYFHVASLTQSAVEQLVPPPVFHGVSEKQAAREKDVDDAGEKDGNNDSDNRSGDEGANKIASGDDVDRRRASNETVPGDRLGSLILETANDYVRPVLLPDQKKDAIKDAIVSIEESVNDSNIPVTANLAPNGSGLLVAFSSINQQFGVLETTAAAILVNSNTNNEIVLGTISNAGGVAIANIPLLAHEESADGIHELALPSGLNGISNTGGDAIGVNWGRWSSDFVLTENGTEVETLGSLHYIYSDKLTSLSQLSALGGLQATYTKVGGTIPTNSAGLPGTLNTLSITANFSTRQINYDISGFGNGGTEFNMKALAVPFQNMTDFQLTDSACSTSCVGNASAVFIGNNAEGAITTYSMQQLGGSDGLNGAAALAR